MYRFPTQSMLQIRPSRVLDSMLLCMCKYFCSTDPARSRVQFSARRLATFTRFPWKISRSTSVLPHPFEQVRPSLWTLHSLILAVSLKQDKRRSDIAGLCTCTREINGCQFIADITARLYTFNTVRVWHSTSLWRHHERVRRYVLQ